MSMFVFCKGVGRVGEGRESELRVLLLLREFVWRWTDEESGGGHRRG